MTSASAPGKVILFGEHAVVYGRPALAVPVQAVQARAFVEPAAGGFWIDAPAIGESYRLDEALRDAGDPLALAVHLVCRRAEVAVPEARLRLDSTIPMASGLGSGAAVCTAAVRALAAHLGLRLEPAEVAGMVFETEKLLHGTPSGIDNTVVAFEQPVYFVRGQAPRPLRVARPFRLLIGDTGRPSPTRVTVGDVRAGRADDPARYERLFDAIGSIAEAARDLIEAGRPEQLGPLMTRNHALLRELGVSSPELDGLVSAACRAGAGGAKLSGGGRGGNMLALVDEATAPAVQAALLGAGAANVLSTVVGAETNHHGATPRSQGRL
jgi:mevalonate kinase